MKSGALKISKLRLVVWWRLDVGGALEAGEAGCEVAAAEEGLDGGGCGGAQGAEGLPVVVLVVGEEVVPAVVNDLPEGRGAGVAWLVDGGHEYSSYEHFSCEARLGGMDRM